eukprot:gnl/Trimastix_PCT/1820.p1 GENE.gnl/Trimastix_PCT/1820~~gnl/Trimastix_PCT/1820.p1  ORF type:complete len:284 (+),score=75.27 gnl/Trimastix_PCT/1820:90-941(+)
MSVEFETINRRPGASLRVFCFANAGAGSVIFGKKWQNGLPENVEFCAMSLPGRLHRRTEPVFRTMAHLIPAIVVALEPMLGEKPFAFLGHSVGATICYATARALRDQGKPIPLHLFVSGRYAPHLPYPHQPVGEMEDRAFVRTMQFIYGESEGLQNPDLRDFVVPPLKADMQVGESYRHVAGAPLDCSLTTWGGSEDQNSTPALIDPWKTLVAKASQRFMVPDGHLFLDHATYKRQLSQELHALIRREGIAAAPAAPAPAAAAPKKFCPFPGFDEDDDFGYGF